MAIKLWEREKKEYTQSRYIKQGDIFSFFYENQYFFFGRVLAAKPKEYCIAVLYKVWKSVELSLNNLNQDYQEGSVIT